MARHVQLQFETAGIILQFETAGIICLHEHYRRNEIGLIVKLRHQFIHLFENIYEVISKVLFFNITQKFTNLLVQLSIFLIDLFVGTYRLSSHARLEAFVIQTRLNFVVGINQIVP